MAFQVWATELGSPGPFNRGVYQSRWEKHSFVINLTLKKLPWECLYHRTLPGSGWLRFKVLPCKVIGVLRYSSKSKMLSPTPPPINKDIYCPQRGLQGLHPSQFFLLFFFNAGDGSGPYGFLGCALPLNYKPCLEGIFFKIGTAKENFQFSWHSLRCICGLAWFNIFTASNLFDNKDRKQY